MVGGAAMEGDPDDPKIIHTAKIRGAELTYFYTEPHSWLSIGPKPTVMIRVLQAKPY